MFPNLSSKLAGVFYFLLGFFLVFYFPGKVGGYISSGGARLFQPIQMSHLGILIGLILMGLGVYILIG